MGQMGVGGPLSQGYGLSQGRFMKRFPQSGPIQPLPRLIVDPKNPARLECSVCHTQHDMKSVYMAWLNLYQSSFLFLWLHRLARKGGRNLVGDAMDSLLPFPKSWKTKISKKFKSTVAHYDANNLDYSEILRRFRAGRPVSLSEYIQKTIVNVKIINTIRRFYEGRIYMGVARFILVGITFYDVGKYAYRAYQHPEKREQNLQKCLRQAIKWTIGTEIGNLGFDVGVCLTSARKEKLVTGFLMDALFSALFDKALLSYF